MTLDPKCSPNHLAGLVLQGPEGPTLCPAELLPGYEADFPISTRFRYGLFDPESGQQVGRITRGHIITYGPIRLFGVYLVRPHCCDAYCVDVLRDAGRTSLT